MSKIYYFGCVRDIGHYLFMPSERGPVHPHVQESREMAWASICDGGLGLGDDEEPQDEGRGIWAYVHGYSIVSFWDRTVDSRGGSTSSFLLKGLYSFATVLHSAKEFFPNIFKRFTFEPMMPNAEATDRIGFATAVEDFRIVLATYRGRKGRDFIREQPYGLLLDALDAGAGKLLGTDMDTRTHGGRCANCGGTIFAVIEDSDTRSRSCLNCGKVVGKKEAHEESVNGP